MPSAQPLRILIPLMVGLAIGATGGVLFFQSLPAREGSAEDRARQLEVDLHHSKNRIATLEGQLSARRPAGALGRLADPQGRRELADGTRQLAENIRDGRPVSPDDIFRASQPLLRDLAPLFDRVRIKNQQAVVDTMTGELARKYRLSPEAKTALKNWFQDKAEERAREWTALLTKDGTRIEDLVRASQTSGLDAGLDTFLPAFLPPDQQAAFHAERMAERDRRVQEEADRKVQRLSSIALLDEAQRDQIFSIMARSSKDYEPSMVLQGSQGQVLAPAPVGDREAAVLAILRPDQRAAYIAEKERRRKEAARDMEAVGLTLPANWRMFDDDNF